MQTRAGYYHTDAQAGLNLLSVAMALFGLQL